jgi:hypothetical protein
VTQEPQVELKAILSELANTVADLPKDLQPVAFSALLGYQLSARPTKDLSPQRPLSGNREPHALPDLSGAAGGSFGEFFSGFKSDLKSDEKLLTAIAFACDSRNRA